MGVLGPVLRGQFVLAFVGGAREERQALRLRIGVDAPAEFAGHLHAMGLIQVGIRAVEGAPPLAKATPMVAAGEIAMEDDPIHAIVASFDRRFMRGRKIIALFHALEPIRRGTSKPSARCARTRERILQRETFASGCATRLFFQVPLGKSLVS